MNTFPAIKIESLKPWKNNDAEDNSAMASDEESRIPLKFPVTSSINEKIYLCQGGISRLELDGIIVPINEVTLNQTVLAKELHQCAGLPLGQFYKTLKGVKTSNAVLGSGYDLPARYIIHVMEPGMNIKFKSAVLNALHRSYRNAMEMAAENKLKTVGFVPLYDSINPSLDEEMAHVALGTIRCCLNKLNESFQAVVFTVDEAELEMYLKLLPAYFPRSVKEALDNSHLVSSFELGDWGERVIADRAIRITDLPVLKQPLQPEPPGVDIDSGVSDCDGSNEITSAVVTRHSFSSMSDDNDESRKNLLKSLNDKKENSQERIYRRLLRLSRTEDLTEISSMKALYLSGKDRDGSPFAVLVAKHMNIPHMNADKALLHFIRTLDSMVNEAYSLVYFHTSSQAHNHPPRSFIKRIYNVLDVRYKRNLKRLLIVHPTFSSRIFAWIFTTFSTRGLSGQVTSIKSIPELYKLIAPDQIDIPPFVSDYDLKVNHDAYQREVHQVHSMTKSMDNLARDVL